MFFFSIAKYNMSPGRFRYDHQGYKKALEHQEDVLERVLVLEF